MEGGIFLLRDRGGLVKLVEREYEAEDRLQALLADYPDLLAGEQVNQSNPRRWLHIKREAGVPAEEGGTDRWSLDHLFLDQDAIPTIVEVKRSSDTRIRREVVGQMLDYAANATRYWPVDRMREHFAAACAARSEDPSLTLVERLGPEVDVDQFWEAARRNLREGRVRLIFVADVIPSELRAIVEFLNLQMRPAEVLAIEIRQYVGGDADRPMYTLVPRVIGQTEAAKQAKGAEQRAPVSEGEFLEEMESRQGRECADTIRRVIEWARPRGSRFDWQRIHRNVIFWPCFDQAGEVYFPFGFRTDGSVVVASQYLRLRSAFRDEQRCIELFERLNRLPGIALPIAINGRPSFSLSALVNSQTLEGFLDVFQWIVDLARREELGSDRTG